MAATSRRFAVIGAFGRGVPDLNVRHATVAAATGAVQ
jgi:hypothetical protein